jgi:hypothetical protein
MPLEKDDIKLIEDKLALIESNIRAVREYLDERTAEIQELSDEIMKILRKK